MGVVRSLAVIMAFVAATSTSASAQKPSQVEPSREVSGRRPTKHDADVAGLLRYEPTGLSLLRPYKRGKIPVLFIHGLWANPLSWSGMVKSLEADAASSTDFSSGRGVIRRATRSPIRLHSCGATWTRCAASSTLMARTGRSTGWSWSDTAWEGW